ncbi:hypothetical protein MCOR25_006215 [Pyricularia grisea]|uniref:CFEM domain-containing protein n=1 Tax=Pyricularia grisea TaxID=148305 RepID=A0A6P8ATP6_PYRGI|nr:uncharacterized protein PgNI_09086 [Pyricularia grisea]KAI6362340.1 hypothetical protein MCOR25_006215 [Pyricularia grisea]TLD05504.1 hypothetical protein PgNI_09086 [Pyricularia grisea]
MQFKNVLVAAFAAMATAQDISQLPFCALSCFITNSSVSGCSSVLNFACSCASTAYFDAVTACAQNSCSAADQATTRAWAVATCNSVGVPLPN